jgi:hypothetical protein
LNPQVRFMSTSHAVYRARANSSPSASLPQCWTVIVVGLTDTIGGTFACGAAIELALVPQIAAATAWLALFNY